MVQVDAPLLWPKSSGSDGHATPLQEIKRPSSIVESFNILKGIRRLVKDFARQSPQKRFPTSIVKVAYMTVVPDVCRRALETHINIDKAEPHELEERVLIFIRKWGRWTSGQWKAMPASGVRSFPSNMFLPPSHKPLRCAMALFAALVLIGGLNSRPNYGSQRMTRARHVFLHPSVGEVIEFQAFAGDCWIG